MARLRQPLLPPLLPRPCALPSLPGLLAEQAVCWGLPRRRCGLFSPHYTTLTHTRMPLYRCTAVLQALIEGLDIGRDMDDIYALMGACPQHDLLWDGLTGGWGCGGVWEGERLVAGWALLRKGLAGSLRGALVDVRLPAGCGWEALAGAAMPRGTLVCGAACVWGGWRGGGGVWRRAGRPCSGLISPLLPGSFRPMLLSSALLAKAVPPHAPSCPVPSSRLLVWA